MQLKTILNQVERYKSFVYQEARWANAESKTEIEIPIPPRVGGRPVCSGCGQTAPGYDRLAERRFEFVPFWQMAVYFVYAMRRVDCPRCGVKVEAQTPQEVSIMGIFGSPPFEVKQNIAGVKYMSKGDYREAERAFPSAMQSAPDFMDAHCNYISKHFV